MPWIREEEAGVGGINQDHVHQPRGHEAVRNANQTITFGSSSLTRVQEECIAAAVSAANHCRY